MNANSSGLPDLEVDQATFEAEVLQSPQPVLVAFRAPWSRPCQVIDLALEEVKSAGRGALKVVKVDADENPDLSLWYDVQSVPTLLYFIGGNLRARLVGTVSAHAILAKLQAVSDPGQAPTPRSPPSGPTGPPDP